MIFERALLGCAELGFLPGGECPSLPEPLGGRGGRGRERRAVQAEWEGKGHDPPLRSCGVLSLEISLPSHLPRGPGKFVAVAFGSDPWHPCVAD